ncbi:MAG: SDR family oxidoreductase [Caldilineaceae bacterium]|nr:SDR family oxidoreductase [Caldilineaceae bacterium]
MTAERTILVTGATGYVGGRLVPRLLQEGYRVRVLARDLARLQGRSWIDEVEVVQGNVLDAGTLPPAMAGVDGAYYLIHSMNGSGDFHERDLLAARQFGQAARDAGVQRIIYLGGLGDPEADLSKHLQSRQQTGQALQEAGVPVTELRAAVIVGSGSASFEMIRYLTEHIPVMVCPRWVYTRIQPIGIRDVLAYLVAALDTPESSGEVIEIGGADVLTYGEMMLGYARVRGLRRLLLPVPVLTPRLSSYWVHWMTPIPAGIARPLIEGLRNEVIVRDDKARQLFSHIEPVDYQTAVARALERLDAGRVETAWSDALTTSRGDIAPVVLMVQDGMIMERRERKVGVHADDLYRSFIRFGGDRGWPYMNGLWRLRGALDRLLGGVGFRRGRRDPDDVRVGDAIDFWRVEEVKPGRLLRLRAELKLPGQGWMQLESEPIDKTSSLLVQTAFFAPKGLLGTLYWYLLYPFHSLIFSGLLRKFGEQAESLGAQPQVYAAESSGT